MTHQEIEKKVIEIVANKFSADVSKITGDTRLADDLGVDSFGAVELVFELEENFGLKIPDSDISQIRTISDIVVYLVTWLSKNGTPKA